METKERVREYIQTEIMLEETSSGLTDETPLLRDVIDSLGLMQLVQFLEEEFELDIDDVDITSDNFTSLATIDRFIQAKLSEQQPQPTT